MTGPRTFSRRIATVTAIQFTGENLAEVQAFLGQLGQYMHVPPRLLIETPSGQNECYVGDWIAQNPSDSTGFYVIRADQFDKLYHPEPLD